MSRLKHMRLIFGPFPNVCANCCHLKIDYFRPHAKKCEVYSRKSDEATDWSETWPACGAFNMDVKDRNIFEKLYGIRKKKPDDQLDGQMSFDMEVKE